MTDSTPHTASRIPSLDGLRTVSIFLVIVSHGFNTLGFRDAFNLGSLGVRCFFVISGFLITGLLLNEFARTKQINLIKFYFRRTMRIFPPYYFYLLVLLALSIVGWIDMPLASFWPAFTYTSNYIHPAPWNLGHTWSLSVEEQFYLIFPGILVMLGQRRTAMLLMVLVVISPLVRVMDFKLSPDQAVWVTKGFHANADALAIGCLLTFFREQLHGNEWYRKALETKLFWLVPPVIFLFNSQTDHPLIYAGISNTVCNLLFALCLDWAVTNHKANLIGRLLNSAPMVMIGMLSYSIYLWQQPFLNHTSGSWLTHTPFNLIATLLCAVFSYLIIEKPSLNLRQKWEAMLFPKTT